MSSELGDLRWALLAMDEAIDRLGVERHSIAPGREYATTLLELGDDHLFELPPGPARAWTDLMVRLAKAILRHFPDNVCWDLDFIAAHYAWVAKGRNSFEQLSNSVFLLEHLHKLFGAESIIRFRYVHDLSLGFDWARWVRKLPDERRTFSPYSPEFLRRMMVRGRQISGRIQSGKDPDFPPIEAGEWRNPFPFRREPLDELKVLRALAKRGELPLEVWDRDATPKWEKDYGQLRELQAERYQLTK